VLALTVSGGTTKKSAKATGRRRGKFERT
jgi:hypothetical protein